MRRQWVGAFFVAATTMGRIGAQELPMPSDAADQPVRARFAEGQDAYFAANHYTSTTLLHLRRDGTFAGYNREHMFVAQSDEGRWKQNADGEVLLCSHFHVEPIRAGALTVNLRADDTPGLPALLAAIERRLSELPARRDVRPKDLMPVVVRSWLAKDASGRLPPGGISPDVSGDDKRVSRKDLLDLAIALRERIANRNGNLTSQVAMRYRDLVWLSGTAASIENEMLEAYRNHKEGPFLPGFVTTGVDAETFADLLGTRQPFIHYPEMNVRIPRRALLSDFGREPIETPQCGDYAEGAAPLPVRPEAGAAILPPGEEIGFVMDSPPGADLLLLDADGRFSRYLRGEKESTLTDAGEWTKQDGGLVQLCSHVAFRPLEHERLSLSVDEASYSKLPALLSELRSLLAANRTSASFRSKKLEAVARRVLPATDSHETSCATQRLVGGKAPVTRRNLQSFVDALDLYLRSDTANLVEQKLWGYGTTTWLGDPEGLENDAVVRTLRALGERPCILPGVFMRIPMSEFLDARGPTLATPNHPTRLSAPRCAGFKAKDRVD